MAFGDKAGKSAFNINSLVGEVINKNGSEITEIGIESLVPYNNGNQPFKMYGEEKMSELTDSVKTNGLLQPILVRPAAEAGKYEILAGHNRAEACKRAGMTAVKSIILDGLSEEQARLVVTDTNLCQRAEPLPSERAAAYAMQQRALEALGVKGSIDAMAEQYDESRKTVYRYLKLNDLSEELLKAVDEGVINVNAGAKIAALNKEQQKAAAEYIRENPDAKITEETAKRFSAALGSDDPEESAKDALKPRQPKRENKAPRSFVSIKLEKSEIDEISEIPINDLGEFLFFCLQHDELQKEFINSYSVGNNIEAEGAEDEEISETDGDDEGLPNWYRD